MCLGVPGKIVTIYTTDGVRMGKVDFGGVFKEACLDFVPEAQIGDYTIIHVGFAITQLDEEAARASLALYQEMGLLDEEFHSDTTAADASPAQTTPAETMPAETMPAETGP